MRLGLMISLFAAVAAFFALAAAGAGAQEAEMRIRGRVPVDGPVQVRVFVLDPAAPGEPFFCDESTSGFSPTDPGTSNFAVSVRPECIAGRSDDLLVCWSDDACAALTFAPGDVDVGLLSEGTTAMPQPSPTADPVIGENMLIDATLRVEARDGRRQEIPRGTELVVGGRAEVCGRTVLPESFFQDLEGDLTASLGTIEVTPGCAEGFVIIDLAFPNNSRGPLFTGPFTPGSTRNEFVLRAPITQPSAGGSPPIAAPNTGSGSGATGSVLSATYIAVGLIVAGVVCYTVAASLRRPRRPVA
jgi:hypothetical protein